MKITKELEYNNIDTTEEKIFKNRSKSKKLFNNFNDISTEQLDKIKILATKFSNLVMNNKSYKNYYAALQYLSTGYGKQKILSTREYYYDMNPTYDEYMAFVIAACDPTCEMYKAYISCDESLTLFNKKNEARRKVGFFRQIVLQAEKVYYLKYINKLLTNVNKNNTNYLGLLCKIFKSFDNIDSKRCEELKELSIIWNDYTEENSKFQTCIYNLIYQSHLLKINSFEEKLIFFINCIDPELKLLNIYEEENHFDIIKKRSLDELGYYLKDLIFVEKEYKKRFLNEDKKIYIK